MLILSRKPGESIMIGDDIEVHLIEMEDGKVKLGIDAPKNIDILRKELYRQVGEENAKALGRKIEFNNIKDLFKHDKIWYYRRKEDIKW